MTKNLIFRLCLSVLLKTGIPLEKNFVIDSLTLFEYLALIKWIKEEVLNQKLKDHDAKNIS